MSVINPHMKFGARRAIVAALLLGTAVGAGGVAWAVSAQPSLIASASAATAPITVPPVANQAGFATLVQKVKPAVVQIATVGEVTEGGGGQAAPQMQMPNIPEGSPFGDMLRRYFNQRNGQPFAQPGRMEQRALGSGFIVDPAGYIVTNNHVIDGANDISVTLTDGNKYKAKVIGRDSKTDLALLKIDVGHSLPYVAFGDSDAEREGDWVIAVGNPYGLGGSVTAGIISAHGRNINEGPYDDFLQIDAPINPGNSGGPLFNQAGEVVGIDTAIYSPSGGSVGIGFAIPSNVAKTIVAQLRDHGKVARGWLGIVMQPLTPTLAKAVGLPSDHGVLVDSVQDGSPAAQAKLQQGDVITAFAGKPIKTARDMALAVANTPDGKTVDMTVWRGQKQSSVDVTIGSQKTQQVASAGNGNAPVGMSLEALTPDIRNQLDIEPSVSGVVVAAVTPGSKADDSGVRAGDVIKRADGSKVTRPAELAGVIHSAEQQKKEAISLLVMRDGVTSYLGLKLASS